VYKIDTKKCVPLFSFDENLPDDDCKKLKHVVSYVDINVDYSYAS
jgi:hypothetical protein